MVVSNNKKSGDHACKTTIKRIKQITFQNNIFILIWELIAHNYCFR